MKNKAAKSARTPERTLRGRKSLHASIDAGVQRFILESLAKELLVVCFEAFKEHGFSPRDILRLGEHVVADDARPSASESIMQDVSSLARLLSEWTENPKYADNRGRPKVLSVKGVRRPSFQLLAETHFADRSVEEVIRIALKLKAIEYVGSRVAQLGSCVLLSGNRTLILGYAVRAVGLFLHTKQNNSGGTQNPAWPERQAYARLPEDKFAEFLEFMREPIINLADMGNRWLLANSGLDDSSRRTHDTLMGVHAYVFRNP